MAELALGTLGLAGLVTVVLDVWSFVDAGQGYSESFIRLRTKLDLQRALFVNWCTTLGVGTEQGLHPQLDSSELKTVMRNSLIEIFYILSKTDSLTQTYGLRVLNDDLQQRALPISYDSSASTTVPTAIFRPKYEAFRKRLGYSALSLTTNPQQPKKLTKIIAQLVSKRKRQICEGQSTASLWKKTKWAVRDESKLAKLVTDLTELVSGLRALTQSVIPRRVERELALQDLAEINDVDQLRQIQSASEKSSPYSVSVGKRLLQLTPDPSAGTILYSAKSQPISTPMDIYGTASTRSSIPVQKTQCGAEALAAHYRQARLSQTPALINPKFPWGSGGKSLSAPSSFAGIDLLPFRPHKVRENPSMDSAWRGEIDGPVDTPYDEGVFEIQFWVTSCEIDHTADQAGGCPGSKRIWVRFITPICHPLVSIQGHLQVIWKVPCLGAGPRLSQREMVHQILVLMDLVKIKLAIVLRAGWETCFADPASEEVAYFAWQARTMTQAHARGKATERRDTNGKGNASLLLEDTFTESLYRLREWHVQLEADDTCVVEMVGIDEFHNTKVLISFN